MSNTSSNSRPEGTILRNSTKQAPPRQSFDPLAYQMQGLAEPPQNQLPPNQTAVYQSTPARNQQNVNANNATATTVPQGMAQASLDQSYRPGVSGKSTKQALPGHSFDPLAYQMQGLAEPPQNQVPSNQAAVYQSTPARNQRNVNAYNATATTVPQGMAQSSLGQSYRTGAPLQAPQPKQAYAFGDLTKGVVDKGKKADGRNEQSGYKFGMCIANRITRYYCLNHSFSCCPILTFVFMQKVILQEVSSNESSHSSTMQSSVESIFHIQYILSAFLIIISNYTF